MLHILIFSLPFYCKAKLFDSGGVKDTMSMAKDLTLEAKDKGLDPKAEDLAFKVKVRDVTFVVKASQRNNFGIIRKV